MLKDKHSLLLYAIADRKCIGDRDICKAVEDAIKGGATMIELRDKSLSERELIREAKAVKEVCTAAGVPLIVNDNFRAALVAGADGVHVGLHDSPVNVVRSMAGDKLIICATAKTVSQARAAKKGGADFLALGPVFPDPYRSPDARITPELFREIASDGDLPCVALGGINKDNIMVLGGSGASGFGIATAIFSAEDITAATENIRVLAETFGPHD